MKITHAFKALLFLTILNISCSPEDDSPGSIPESNNAAFENGILVSNEGPFNNGTGTVSFVSEDLTSVDDTIFNDVNNEDLGNIVQSIGFNGEEAYIVANVSNTITVVNRNTFESIAKITEGLNNPRFFVVANNKGYVSNWGDTGDATDDYIAIIDLSTYAVQGTISVELGPETLAVQEDILYVAQQGAFGQNNKVTVINTITDDVLTTITVGDVPNAMQFDMAGNLWVLAGGAPSFTGNETNGVLSRINTNTNMVDFSLDFDITAHPSYLNIDEDNLYYFLDGGVYAMDVSETTLPTVSILDAVNFYEMVVENGILYGTDALDFASRGSLLVYNLEDRSELANLTVGIIPGGIYFN